MFRFVGRGERHCCIRICFSRFFSEILSKRQAPSPRVFLKRCKVRLGSVWGVLALLAFSTFIFFFYSHNSVGGDGNVSSITTLASEYSLPQGFRAAVQSPCACLQRRLVAASGLAEDRAAGGSRLRQGALLPRCGRLALLLESDRSW